MSQYYDYKQFWSKRGKDPADDYPAEKKVKILEVLANLQFDSVLEIGAGDGKLTSIIQQFCRPLNHTVIDISQDRLDKIEYNVEKICADITEYNPDKKYDLVIAAHCLLHITPDKIKGVMEKMYDSSKKYVINIDPINFTIPGNWASYNFPHDYFSLWYGFVNSLNFHQVEPKVGLWLVSI